MSAFLLPNEPITSLHAYLATGIGGEGVRRAQAIGATRTAAEVMRSGLRGRGGAGFPTGRKWESVASAPGSRKYVVCNAAEGEPGTFKDRALIRANPYQLVEGLVIAGMVIGAREAFIGLKESFEQEHERL